MLSLVLNFERLSFHLQYFQLFGGRLYNISIPILPTLNITYQKQTHKDIPPVLSFDEAWGVPQNEDFTDENSSNGLNQEGHGDCAFYILKKS